MMGSSKGPKPRPDLGRIIPMRAARWLCHIKIPEGQFTAAPICASILEDLGSGPGGGKPPEKMYDYYPRGFGRCRRPHALIRGENINGSNAHY